MLFRSVEFYGWLRTCGGRRIYRWMLLIRANLFDRLQQHQLQRRLYVSGNYSICIKFESIVVLLLCTERYAND
jgi:hypothetical protein